MGVQERRAREKSETREKILDAARELFVSEGYEGVTMRKVAEKIEYSPTAIYVHFADKEDLFRQLCTEDFRKLGEGFQQVLAAADPAERLRLIGSSYIQFGIHYPNHYRLMFMTPRPDCPDPHGEGHCQGLDVEKGNPEEDAYAMLKLAVEDGIRAGIFRDGLADVELIAQTLWASVHGLISLEIAKKNDDWVAWRPIEQRAELMLDAVLGGLMKRELTK
jgi:AcrR family transcriptional regulator